MPRLPSASRKTRAMKPLFEFPLRVLVADAPGHHVVDQSLELFAQRHYCRTFPVRRRNASTYFSRVRATTSGGSDGTGGCLFQPICSR